MRNLVAGGLKRSRSGRSRVGIENDLGGKWVWRDGSADGTEEKEIDTFLSPSLSLSPLSLSLSLPFPSPSSALPLSEGSLYCKSRVAAASGCVSLPLSPSPSPPLFSSTAVFNFLCPPEQSQVRRGQRQQCSSPERRVVAQINSGCASESHCLLAKMFNLLSVQCLSVLDEIYFAVSVKNIFRL